MTTITEKLLSEGYVKIRDGVWDKHLNLNGTIVQWLYFYNPEKNILCTVHETIVMEGDNNIISHELYQKDTQPFKCQGALIETENVGEYAFIYGWTDEGYSILKERLKFLGIKSKMYSKEKKLAAVPSEFLLIEEKDLPVFMFYFNDIIKELPLS